MGRFIIMVALFALVFFVRLTLDILAIIYFEEKTSSVAIDLTNILHDIFTKLLWFGIYYTILEVFNVMNTLRSQSPEECQKLAQTHSWRKLIVISTIAIFETIQILFEFELKMRIFGN